MLKKAIQLMNNEIYTVARKTVGECVKACTLREDAWYLPDIQRSFVWDAKQTLLLIDSLFRGWPFGVLTIETTRAEDCGTIPPRAFIEVNDLQKEPFERTRFDREEDGLPDEYSLVLDGQQRLQSLVLAFGSKKTKFIQDEASWYWHLCKDRPRKARGVDYETVSAMLALDFEACFRAYQEACGNIAEIRFCESGAVCFAFINGQERSRYQEDSYLPFPVQRLSPSHLRLSKLWDLFNEMSEENDFNVEKSWQSWNMDPEWMKDPARHDFAQKIITYLFQRVYKQEVSYIELKCPKHLDHEEFQKRVVEIFTRLNKAGTQLTVGEVTTAWLKNAWKGNRSLDEVIVDFGKMFSVRSLEAPDFIRFVSSLWAIEDVTTPDRKIIQNKDLTNSALLGQLANWFSTTLKDIQKDLVDFCDELSGVRWIWNEIGAKAIVLAVVVAYRRHVRACRPDGSEQEKALYDKKIGSLNLVRFLANSNWSSYWSAESIANWSEKWAKAIGDSDKLRFHDEFCVLQTMMAKRAKESFIVLKASRNTVRQYYLYLQVWHRLNLNRFKTWQVHMTHGALDVDHCFAFAKWESLLGKSAGQMTVDERNDIDPIVNAFGNCLLLERPKNIAKGKKSMVDFFKDVSEEDRQALLLSSEMVGCGDAELTPIRLKEQIEIRDKKMRSEIEDFIDGKIECV